MKRKISISVEEKVIEQVEEHVRTGIFRNKSHLIELAIRRLVEERKNEIQ